MPEGTNTIVNMFMSIPVNTTADKKDEDQFFLRVILTSVRTIVSRLGLVVIASIYLGSAIRGLILCPILAGPPIKNLIE